MPAVVGGGFVTGQARLSLVMAPQLAPRSFLGVEELHGKAIRHKRSHRGPPWIVPDSMRENAKTNPLRGIAEKCPEAAEGPQAATSLLAQVIEQTHEIDETKPNYRGKSRQF